MKSKFTNTIGFQFRVWVLPVNAQTLAGIGNKLNIDSAII